MSRNNKRYLRGSNEQCPKCGCRKVRLVPGLTFKGFGPGLALCSNCAAIWEPFDPSDIWDRDDPVCSFREPCNNCAFRPGSNEHEDRERWLEIVRGLKGGAQFYCHKGVPIEAGAEHGFSYPKERTKLRLCRGYLKALPGLLKHMMTDRTENNAARTK